jgi:UDP-N-acetylmuramate--alanine ligase
VTGVPIDLRAPGRFHIVGIGGPGMSAIALVLAGMGHRVSGSDLRETPVFERLRAAGISVTVGHRRDQVHGVDAVTASTAVPARNVELDEARRRGIPVLRRAGMLASICACARAVAIAGTHGKTTTTSMLSMILSEAGRQPSFLVGGDVNDVGTGAHWAGARAGGAFDPDHLLVVEADESDGTFLELPVDAAIVTNVEVDHLDYYGSPEAIVAAFDRYLAAVHGPKVVCRDDPVGRRLADKHDAVTYGSASGADFRLVDVAADRGAQVFSVEHDGHRLGEIRLPLRGIHMARNATGAIAMAHGLGVGFEDAASALARFGGVARRFDFRGDRNGITFVDDYAHLPSEIAAVLDGAARGGDDWARIVAVFQPNRYSRMEVLSPEYRDAFVDADVTVITDIYSSGEAPRPGVTGKLVVNAVLDSHPWPRVAWIPRRADLIEYLARELRAGDVCISMGCGDVASLPSEVLARLDEMASAAP